MRHITEAQLHDVRSQAYLLTAELDGIRKSGAIAHRRGSVKPDVPELRKTVALNLVARALGYTSWSHLTLTAKGKEPCTDYVQLFKDHDQARAFFRTQLPGLDSLIVRDMANVLPFFQSTAESPYLFIEEVCMGYDLKAVDLSVFADPEATAPKTPKWTLHDGGDMSVGIFPFTADFEFESPAALDAFLQRHIDLIRADHDGNRMEDLFDDLGARFCNVKA
jgi:hypothetical protein